MKDLNFKIDNEKCIHCGLCLKDCPTKIIEFDENKIPKIDNANQANCMACQHCLAICPTGALSIFNKNPEESQKIKHVNPEDIENLIKGRRSFRKYKQENLEPQTLEKLKNILHWAPTGCNFHDLHFSFIDDIEVMNEFRNHINSKLVKLFSAKPVNGIIKRLSRHAEALKGGQDVIFRGAPHIIVVSTPLKAPCKNIDPIIALSYFELYAQSLGVATVWGGLPYLCTLAMPELCEKLEIPDEYKVSYSMMFGPADIKFERTIQPEPFKITSVKKGEIKKISFSKKLKRYFWNIFAS